MYKIKNECAWCGLKIQNSAGRYHTKGNACDACCLRFASVINKSISQTEADKDLEMRRARMLIVNKNK